MPPWKPEPGYGEFVGARRLTDQQIALIQRWVADGVREGDTTAAAPAPEATSNWHLGEPDVVVTDTWISMGQEHERVKRLNDLEPYRLDKELLSLATPEAFVMHCLPAHPGEEITAEVLYGDRSAVWDQAENRLHTQKALLEMLIAG